MLTNAQLSENLHEGFDGLKADLYLVMLPMLQSAHNPLYYLYPANADLRNFWNEFPETDAESRLALGLMAVVAIILLIYFRRKGWLCLVDSLKEIYFYIVPRQMIPANFVVAWASNKGDVIKLTKSMKAAEELGVQMVKITERKFEYPKQIKASHIGFSTHTW